MTNATTPTLDHVLHGSPANIRGDGCRRPDRWPARSPSRRMKRTREQVARRPDHQTIRLKINRLSLRVPTGGTQSLHIEDCPNDGQAGVTGVEMGNMMANAGNGGQTSDHCSSNQSDEEVAARAERWNQQRDGKADVLCQMENTHFEVEGSPLPKSPSLEAPRRVEQPAHEEQQNEPQTRFFYFLYGHQHETPDNHSTTSKAQKEWKREKEIVVASEAQGRPKNDRRWRSVSPKPAVRDIEEGILPSHSLSPPPCLDSQNHLPPVQHHGESHGAHLPSRRSGRGRTQKVTPCPGEVSLSPRQRRRRERDSGHGSGHGAINGEMKDGVELVRLNGTRKHGRGRSGRERSGRERSGRERTWSNGTAFVADARQPRMYFGYTVIGVSCLAFFVEMQVAGWKFAPLKQNPTIGPGHDILVKVGAKDTFKIADNGEAWRIFTPTVLHAGFVHLIFNMGFLYMVGQEMETTHGWKRFATIYILSGVVATLSSALFLPDLTMVGSSGAIFGLVGARWGDLIQNWDVLLRPWAELAAMSAMTLLNYGMGLLPFIDNFAHTGGLVMGFLTGLVLLPQRRLGRSGRPRPMTRKQAALSHAGASLALVLLVLGLTGLYSGADLRLLCPGCLELSCPSGLGWWDCSPCGRTGFQYTLYTNGTFFLTCPITERVLAGALGDGAAAEETGAGYFLSYCKENC